MVVWSRVLPWTPLPQSKKIICPCSVLKKMFYGVMKPKMICSGRARSITYSLFDKFTRHFTNTLHNVSFEQRHCDVRMCDSHIVGREHVNFCFAPEEHLWTSSVLCSAPSLTLTLWAVSPPPPMHMLSLTTPKMSDKQEGETVKDNLVPKRRATSEMQKYFGYKKRWCRPNGCTVPCCYWHNTR